jgi:hypothetical protein
MLFIHLRLGLPSGLFPSGFPTNNPYNQPNKQTPWPLVRERTIPTDRPPLVDEI